jgi:hypothetical protein
MKRKVFYYIIGILFLCILAYKLFFYLDALEEKRLVQKNASIVRLSPSQIGQIKEGDIILRRGYGYFSDMIAERLNQKPFDVTHSGIIVKEHGKWIVIHSLSSDVSSINGVQKQALEDFLMHSQPNKLLITRFKSDIIKTNDEIAGLAKYHLNKGIPFDLIGNYEDSSSMYCTEFILHIIDQDLKLLKIPNENTGREKFLKTMKGMYDTNYFKIIVNTYHSN